MKKDISELTYYDTYRRKLKELITEPDKKITPKAWKSELASIEQKIDNI